MTCQTRFHEIVVAFVIVDQSASCLKDVEDRLYLNRKMPFFHGDVHHHIRLEDWNWGDEVACCLGFLGLSGAILFEVLWNGLKIPKK